MDDKARNRRLALLTAASGYSITLLYLLYGGTSQGKHWFRNLVPHDSNGGALLLIVFTLPLFIANTAALLLLKDGAAAAGDNETKESNLHTNRRAHQKSCYNKIQSTTRRILASSRLFTVAFVILPCVAFFLCSAQRHYLSAMGTYPVQTDSSSIDNINRTALLEDNDDYNYQIAAWRWKLVHHISNCSAIVGLIAFSHLLIPVSKHSPLIVLLNWTPQEALIMHKYAGRLAVCGVVVHGFGHVMHAYWRWWSMFVSDYDIITESNVLQSRYWMEKSFWRAFIPPMQCWQQKFRSNISTEIDFGPGCINNDDSCSCLDFWINFTGLLGLIALLVLMVGSLNHIRRNHYNVFYVVHIIAAPLFILASVLHYNRSIMYMCPSLLYYASQSVPVYVESWLSRRQSKGSRIVSVSKIPCPSHQRPNGNVLSIEFEASQDAMNKFQPGSYCTLQIPSLSLVAHPFTVNIVPGHSNRLRILMRQIGPFTTHLVELLECKGQPEANQYIQEEKKECNTESQYNPTISLPIMHINVYGTSQRMAQLYHHDSALIVAGGIGITPYLSMLTEIASSSQASSTLKSVVLHWICRDAALIRYVHEQYFAAILDKSNGSDQGGGVSIRIVTHFTGLDEHAYCHSDSLETVSYKLNTCDGTPVKSSAYSVSNTRTLVTFATIFCFGTAATMYCYTYLQSVEVVSTRILGLLAICIISIVISTISFMVSSRCQTEKVKYLPLSTNERYGSTSLSQKSQGGDYSYTNNTSGYEFNFKGRPSEDTLFSSLQGCENESIGLFLCGPPLMVKQSRAFLSMKKFKDVDVYEEIFEV
eukprot:scaffold8324_cov78-Skeletonema_dohrnii-CCMP3373.AAC.3